MSKFSLESCFKIYDDTDGTFIEVRVDPDMNDHILVHTTNQASEDHYGSINLSIPVEQAELLIEALKKQINEMFKS